MKFLKRWLMLCATENSKFTLKNLKRHGTNGWKIQEIGVLADNFGGVTVFLLIWSPSRVIAECQILKMEMTGSSVVTRKKL